MWARPITLAKRQAPGSDVQSVVGDVCGGTAAADSYPDVSKEGTDMKQRLEEWAHSGESMEGFILRYAQLQRVTLIDPPAGII